MVGKEGNRMNSQLLHYKTPIIGRGWIALVEMKGRYTVDGNWIYGVNPGAIAGNGEEAFYKALFEVHLDIAEEAESFDDFKKEVERFFYQCDEESLRTWENNWWLQVPWTLSVEVTKLDVEPNSTKHLLEFVQS